MEGISHLGYAGFGRRRGHGSAGGGGRGFKVSSRRFSVQRLRAKFACLVRALSRWRCRYGRALRALKRSICCRESSADSTCSSASSSSSCLRRSSSSRRNLVKGDASRCTYYYGSGVSESCKVRSFARSNSVYSEAIADCLEFIKRSSVSVDEYRDRPKIEFC
ncbi:hypothetical protein ACJRO7_035728 [Eucalyptus globulus]|uniref:Uncharacterized protein n=1 Tax=Eucalyptus globulus TaxID=34317 RepID=A0ABD3JHE1_EUCGL